MPKRIEENLLEKSAHTRNDNQSFSRGCICNGVILASDGHIRDMRVDGRR